MNELLKNLHITEEQYQAVNVGNDTNQHLLNIQLMLEEIQAVQKFNSLSTWFVTPNPEAYKGLSPYEYVATHDDPEGALEEVDTFVENMLKSIPARWASSPSRHQQRMLCKENLRRMQEYETA